jgi:uncharacterized protein YqgV (UPF0045/DUF77 family)
MGSGYVVVQLLKGWIDFLVMEAIGKSHEAIHGIGCPRIATDIRIGTRLDKVASMEDKVRTVRELLASEGVKLNEG